MAKQVIFSIKGTIDKRSRERLFGHGYLVIEVDDFSKIRFMSQIDSVTSDDIFMSALIGLESGDYPKTHKAAFASELIQRIKEREKKANPGV